MYRSPALRNYLLIFGLCLSIALTKDDSAVVFGEDVAFGGVFRCTMVCCTSILNAIPFAYFWLGPGRGVWSVPIASFNDCA